MPTYILTFLLLFSTVLSLSAQEQASHAVEEGDSESTRLIDVNYQELRQVMDSYKGEKAVLLNVWATWCGPCVEELPYIKKLQETYPDRLQVILLSADLKSDRSRVVPFLQKKGMNWTTYFKAGDNQRFLNQLSDQWSGALPFTRILDRKGKVVAEWQGSAEFEKFHKHVKKAIEKHHETP